jgi:hypothetical protein
MEKITLENLRKNPNLKNAYQTEVLIDGQKIKISIDPDGVDLSKTIALANKIMSNFELYETKARKRIVLNYLDNYNENWRDEEDDEPELNESEFSENLTLNSISFLSDASVDIFYSENGMFGNHSLVAQSFDGENFETATMYG